MSEGDLVMLETETYLNAIDCNFPLSYSSTYLILSVIERESASKSHLYCRLDLIKDLFSHSSKSIWRRDLLWLDCYLPLLKRRMQSSVSFLVWSVFILLITSTPPVHHCHWQCFIESLWTTLRWVSFSSFSFSSSFCFASFIRVVNSISSNLHVKRTTGKIAFLLRVSTPSLLHRPFLSFFDETWMYSIRWKDWTKVVREKDERKRKDEDEERFSKTSKRYAPS